MTVIIIIMADYGFCIHAPSICCSFWLTVTIFQPCCRVVFVYHYYFMKVNCDNFEQFCKREQISKQLTVVLYDNDGKRVVYPIQENEEHPWVIFLQDLASNEKYSKIIVENVMGDADLSQFVNPTIVVNTLNENEQRAPPPTIIGISSNTIVETATPAGQTLPTIKHKEDLDAIVGNSRYAFLMFITPWCEACQASKPSFTDSALAFKPEDNVAFAFVDCSSVSALCAAYGIRGYPTFLFFKNGKVDEHYTGVRKVAHFVNFVNMAILDEHTIKMRQNAINIEMEGNVMILTEENLFKALLSSHFVVVQAYVPWSKYYVAFQETWDLLTSHVFPDKDNVAFGKLDCSQFPFTCNEQHVNGYPEIMVYVGGIKKSIFLGRRSEEMLTSYLTSLFDTIK
eukprot:m.64837 g.64837  ORF g.64837 m.64837 type:complete len:397 (+) comp8125_c0_seq3:151-1341(+)